MFVFTILLLSELLLVQSAPTTTNYDTEHGNLTEGDILISKKPGVTTYAKQGGSDTWVTRKIPIQTANNTDPQIRDAFFNAVGIIMKNTCIKFYLWNPSADYDYVHVTNTGQGCYSSVGRRGGEQILNLGDGCSDTGIILHELLHALGLWHEQNRSDRDKFVTILYDNIETDKIRNFDKRNDSKELEKANEYDLESIMHYKYNEFALEGKTAIEPNPKYKDFKFKMGQRENVSPKDIEKIDWLYKCDVLTCQNPAVNLNVIRVIPSHPRNARYEIGSYVTFKCKYRRYVLVGSSSSMCKSNGDWSGTVPYCYYETKKSSLFYNDMETNDNNWQWKNITANATWRINRGQTPSDNTGPHTDHTYENSTGNYMYMEATGLNVTSTAQIKTPKIYPLYRSSGVTIRYWYNMFGEGMGKLDVIVEENGTNRTVDTKTKSQPTNDWHLGEIFTSVGRPFYVIFEATRGELATSDIAIDDVLIGPSRLISQYSNAADKFHGPPTLTKPTKPPEYDTFESVNGRFDPGMDIKN